MIIHFTSGRDRHRWFVRNFYSIAIICAWFVLIYPPAAQSQAQAAGGVAVSGPKFRVIRALAGTEGVEKDGKLLLDNPQTVFHLGRDKKVMVYFEWQGPVGFHKFEGMWKNPDGRVVVISDFQYTASSTEFAGYWTMLLSDADPTGIWTLEARIDGEAAGSFPFQLAADPDSASLKPSARQPLSPSEIYKAEVPATVFVDKLDAAGKVLERGSGFFLDEHRLLTAFENMTIIHFTQFLFSGTF